MNTNDIRTDIKTYVYGAREPTDGLQYILEEEFKQRVLWDELVHNVNKSLQEIAVEAAKTPEIGSLQKEIREITDEITGLVKAKRSRNAAARTLVDSTDLELQIDSLIKKRKPLYEKQKEMMKSWRKEHKDFLDDVESRRIERHNEICRASDLHYDNKWRVKKDFPKALAAHRKKFGMRRMRTLDPVRNYGQLLLTGAAPKGLPKDARRALPILEDFYEGRVSKLQMNRVDPRAFDKSISKSEQRKLRQTEVIWCVDKQGHRAVVPVSLHRPFPDGYSVAEMRLCWKKEAGKTKWSVQFVLKNDQFIPDKHESRLACGIDIGWRAEKEGSLLTATVIGSDGMPDWHLLPSHWTGGMDQMERLKSHADEITLKMANEWWERLDQLPADLLPAFERWTPKKAASKIDTALLRAQIKKRMLQAKESGVRVEESGFPESLIWWYREYNHLMIWHDNKREKLRRERKQEYIKFARYLCERYAIIGIEKFNLSNVAKVKVKPGQKENNLSEKSRANRVRVAQYEFRQVLANTASKFGTEIVEVAGASTQHCHKCGHKNVHTVGSGERSFECRKCGAVWDRDLNAAQNICDAVTGRLQEKAEHSTQTFRQPESSLTVCASA